MAQIDKKHFIKLQGKDFVTYPGLLDAAHNNNLLSIETELLQAPRGDNDNTAIAIAKVNLDGKIFTGIGDANEKNTGAFVKNHIIRMAETRAKARALRDALNIAECSAEELADDIPDTKPQGQSPKHDTEKQALDEFGGNAFNAKRDERPISVNQAKRMFAISGGKEEIVRNVIGKYGYTHSQEVKRYEYDAICKEIEEAV